MSPGAPTAAFGTVVPAGRPGCELSALQQGCQTQRAGHKTLQHLTPKLICFCLKLTFSGLLPRGSRNKKSSWRKQRKSAETESSSDTPLTTPTSKDTPKPVRDMPPEGLRATEISSQSELWSLNMHSFHQEDCWKRGSHERRTLGKDGREAVIPHSTGRPQLAGHRHRHRTGVWARTCADFSPTAQG